ncbi:hypothetical protein TEA_019097 [Camellia sinensis var. sinensis]|uniref:Uncharacterized protein n=1 Tax=Camellia sinensis var. sinensis TaxID=542762 RepID=A0A4S4DA28_CAMSN|nr:hypothetical protein TEA_019097 [Camellia sinensis var. sinensis]
MGSLLPSLSLSLSLSLTHTHTHTNATKPHLFSPRAAHLTVAHRRATSHIATAANRSRTSPLSRLQFTFRILDILLHLKLLSLSQEDLDDIYRNIVNLTLIDLPGLTKVSVEGQSDTIVEDIENVVHSYVEKVQNLSWQEQ